jgi:SAM-dependent methyltransferase
MHNVPSTSAPVSAAHPTRTDAAAVQVTPDQAQRAASDRVWGPGGLLRRYGGRRLRPAERVLFERYSEALSGTVLELGCGGGRLTAHLAGLTNSVTGVDLALTMVEHCRTAYPQATFRQGDLRDLSAFESESWDAIVAGFAVIDVLSDDERQAFLDEAHRLLRPAGLLIFSTHNLACAPRLRGPLRSINATNPVSFVSQVLRLPRSARNRRRLLPFQQFCPDHAILNDPAHDFSLLHYYITRDEQEHQLARHGFELRECLRMDGELVGAGEQAADWDELHYAATRTSAGGAGA